MQFTLIVRTDGTDRTYVCSTYTDASFLFEALCSVAQHVEWWQGSALVTKYVNN
jgi:hypothetical protein